MNLYTLYVHFFLPHHREVNQIETRILTPQIIKASKEHVFLP